MARHPPFCIPMKAKRDLVKMKLAIRKNTNTRQLLLVSSLLMFAVIVSGGVMRSTGVQAGAPARLMFGNSPQTPYLEIPSAGWIHGIVTLVMTFLVIAIAIKVWRHSQNDLRLRKEMVLLLGLLAAGICLGVWIAFNIGGDQFTWISSLHLVVALASQAVLLAATVESIA